MSDDHAPSRRLWGRPLDADRFVWGPDDVEIMRPTEAKLTAAESRYLGLVSIPVVVPAHESHSKTGAPEHVDTYVRHIDVDLDVPRDRSRPDTSPLPDIVGDQFFPELSPGAQDLVRRTMKEYGIDSDELVNEILSRIGSREEALRTGQVWYENANSLAHGLSREYDITPEQGGGVLAVISPRCAWEMNAETASRVVDFWSKGHADGLSPDEATYRFREMWLAEGWGGLTKGASHAAPGQGPRPAKNGALPENIAKAFEILQNPDSLDRNLSTIKIRSFYENIVQPHQTEDVTVDTHMGKALGYISANLTKKQVEKIIGKGSAQREQLRKDGTLSKADTQVQGIGYVIIAGATRQVAAQWGIAPDIVQAAYWLKVQPTAPPGWRKVNQRAPGSTAFSSRIAGRKI